MIFKTYKIYEKDLYRMAIAIVKNNEDALDCIQDSILKAYKFIGKLEKYKILVPSKEIKSTEVIH